MFLEDVGKLILLFFLIFWGGGGGRGMIVFRGL